MLFKFIPVINWKAMIGAVLAGINVASSLFGSLKSAQANRRTDRKLGQMQSRLDADKQSLHDWFNTEYNTNYLDTAEAKSAVTLARNSMKEQMKAANQDSAIAGASDEARVAMADKAQENLADVSTTLAGQGTRRKDSVRRENVMREADLNNRQENLDAMTIQNQQAKAQNFSNLVSSAASAGIGAAQADGMGAFDKWDGKLASLYKNKRLSRGLLSGALQGGAGN